MQIQVRVRFGAGAREAKGFRPAQRFAGLRISSEFLVQIQVRVRFGAGAREAKGFRPALYRPSMGRHKVSHVVDVSVAR